MRSLCLVLLAVLAAGCASSSTNTYSGNDVGQVIETAQGTVVSSRVVEIKGGSNSNVGAIGGGLAGATTGAVIAKGGNASLAAGILGGLAGAGIGYLVEQEARSGEGIEYVIRMDDGRVVTLVQNREPEEQPVDNGQRVLVQYGTDYTRIIADPTGSGAAGGAGAGGLGGAPPSTWKNPDVEEAPDPYQQPYEGQEQQ